MHDKRKIKALIIDDSALMRQVLTAVLQQDPEIHVVGTAANPLIAREKIKSLKPDVLTLDVEMPGMDGITFLEKLMRLHPLPVVMVSSHTEKGAAATLRALDLGAVDFVAKPQGGVREGLSDELVEEIRAKVRAAAGAHVRPAPARLPSKPGFRWPSSYRQPVATALSSSAPRPAAPRPSRKSWPNCRARRRASPSCSTCRPGSRPRSRSG
jgi:two-component system, chemotaxis family, protein-glutamate methylesterase/glutaminase